MKAELEEIQKKSKDPNERQASKSFFEELRSFLKTIVIIVVLALFVRVSFVEAYKIPSGSMIPTLQIGDYILVNKLSFGIRVPKTLRWPQGFELPWEDSFILRYSMPVRGDIVVFTRADDPVTLEDESRTNLIKRVIGLPGEEVEVRGTSVFINGALIKEDYARWIEGGPIFNSFGPQVVPEDSILLLGDNRDNSRDSRFWSDPFIPIDRVKGKAVIVYWSLYDWKRIGHLVR